MSEYNRDRVLFVDDEQAVLDGLTRALHRERYQVITCTSADEALLLMAELEVSVVVSDLEMPGCHGLTFLAQVRQKYPDTVRMVLSGNASLDACLSAINEGQIHRFFTKPCERADLIQGLREGIRQQRLLFIARYLLGRCRDQMSVLHRLQQQSELSELCRDADGAFIFDELPDDIEDILQ